MINKKTREQLLAMEDFEIIEYYIENNIINLEDILISYTYSDYTEDYMICIDNPTELFDLMNNDIGGAMNYLEIIADKYDYSDAKDIIEDFENDRFKNEDDENILDALDLLDLELSNRYNFLNYIEREIKTETKENIEKYFKYVLLHINFDGSYDFYTIYNELLCYPKEEIIDIIEDAIMFRDIE